MRLPLVTHSRPARPGLVGGIIAAARRSGRSGVAGDGANRWPATHSLDVATLLRLVLERGDTGRRWHAIAEEGIPVRAIAERIGERLEIPVATIPDEQLQQHFGFVGDLIGSDVPAASRITREELDWTPAGPTLLDDLAADDFFR
ncbi:hypothetical protein [Amnibacterium endophyticum]|uniref:3-beta hydroxysteroid dehydrogenase n=1 Tax=Amnibacterium endophyticum TaxID=2109337 RepID=A0ABW4LFM0_9MICO